MTGIYRRSVLVFGLLAIVLGFAMLVRTAYEGGGTVRLRDRRALRRARHRAPLPAAEDLMARKLPQLQRALDAPALASVAYGEIASSIYFALGIIALHALGFTPVVLGIVGLLFLIVALSYAEGTASIRETGGAATFVRVAFNDLAGFLTGWVLFLDYLIVIALSALFVPHYLGLALGIDAIARRPGDVIAACVVVAADRKRAAAPADAALQHRVRRARPRPRHAGAARDLRLRDPLLRQARSRATSRSARIRRGTTSRSRCRSRCSRTPASRRSPTMPRRCADPAATCRAASSARSRSSSSSTS